MRKPKIPITKKLRKEVLARDGERCRYCGSTQGPFWIDHVYPASKGGETTINNLVTACKTCNLRKQTRVGVWPKSEGYKPVIQRPAIFSVLFLISAIIALVATIAETEFGIIALGLIIFSLACMALFFILGAFYISILKKVGIEEEFTDNET